MKEIAIKVTGLVTKFGKQVVHDNLDLTVYQGEVLGVVGGSGSGKTVLLNAILGLNEPAHGQIEVLGVNRFSRNALKVLASKWGVLFQNGALFSSMNVMENIMVPMREVLHLPEEICRGIAPIKLQMVGLEEDVLYKFPRELSGGMIKRVALARALALDAELLFLDEPTSGLDPIAAAEFDQLIKRLQSNLNLTIFMITHDLDTLFNVCDRVAVIVDKNVIVDKLERIVENPHPWIHAYFKGIRGKALLGMKHGNKS